MCGWRPCAREASVWEACCSHSGCHKHVLNCLVREGGRERREAAPTHSVPPRRRRTAATQPVQEPVLVEILPGKGKAASVRHLSDKAVRNVSDQARFERRRRLSPSRSPPLDPSPLFPSPPPSPSVSPIPHSPHTAPSPSSTSSPSSVFGSPGSTATTTSGSIAAVASRRKRHDAKFTWTTVASVLQFDPCRYSETQRKDCTHS